ncbi:MAG: ribonuclease P protein component [Bdellovibrionia bacterium]
MSPEHRLHYHWEYRKFFSGSKVLRLSECTIFQIKNELPHFRLGITIKARGSSVQRNQVKRQIRESFRKQASALGSYDYNVVIPSHKKMTHPYPLRLGKCLRNQLAHARTSS